MLFERRKRSQILTIYQFLARGAWGFDIDPNVPDAPLHRVQTVGAERVDHQHDLLEFGWSRILS
jgi:hypothetical protein